MIPFAEKFSKMQKELLLKTFEDLIKTERLLRYSLYDYEPYEVSKDYSSEELTKYDAFSFRFAKFVEMALRFMVALEIYLFGEKSDTLRNRLLRLERAGYISDGELWLMARALRNEIIHAYMPEELARLYTNMEELSKRLLEELDSIKKKLREKFLIVWEVGDEDLR